jgi:hypothetical protein
MGAELKIGGGFYSAFAKSRLHFEYYAVVHGKKRQKTQYLQF